MIYAAHQRRRMSLLTLVLLLTASLLLVSWAASSSPAVTVSQYRQVAIPTLTPFAGSEPGTVIQPHLAVDPNDANHMVAIFQHGRYYSSGGVTTGYALTTDGGASWTQGEMPYLTKGGQPPANPPNDFDRATQARVAFGPDNGVYVASSVMNDINLLPGLNQETMKSQAVAVNRSSDGGRTWTAPPALVVDYRSECISRHNCPESLRPYLAVDTNAASPYLGTVYLTWTKRNAGAGLGIFFNRSTDDGVTWSDTPATVVLPPNLSLVPNAPVILVEPSGRVIIVFDSFIQDCQQVPGAVWKHTLLSKMSSDSGATWSSPLKVVAANRYTSCLTHDPRQPYDQRASAVLSATVDPTTGNLYVVWRDSTRLSTLCHPACQAANDLVMSRSTDHGLTWDATPTQINRDSLNNHFTPGVAVVPDGTGRYVGVTYYEQDSTQLGTINAYYQGSIDGGLHWATPVRLTSQTGPLDLGQPIQVNCSANDRGGRMLGDYQGLVAAGPTGRLLSVWSAAYPRTVGIPCATPSPLATPAAYGTLNVFPVSALIMPGGQ